MKKFFLILFASFSLLAFNACKDDDEQIEDPVPVVPTPEEPEEPEVPVVPIDTTPDYLLMHYATGFSLDDCLMADILHCLDEGTNDKVKMTFQFKLSNLNQILFSNSHDSLFIGTRRFTADDNKHLVGLYDQYASKKYRLMGSELSNVCKDICSEKIGDGQYDFSSEKGLSDFIKWSKEKYPGAKRTILFLSGHGFGWDFEYDGVLDSGYGQTRATLIDNNTNLDALTLDEIVNAVKQTGGVDMIFCDACKMSMYEYLYGFANCAKYMVGCLEETGCGANYKQLLKMLKESGTSDQEFEETMHQYIDIHASKDWMGYFTTHYLDIGFFNLTKLDQVTNVLKKITDTLVENYNSDDSIKTYIDKATLKCERVDEIRSYVISDLMRVLDKELDAAGVQNHPFKQLKQELTDVLKSVSHIATVTPDEKPDIDQAYDLCTPGVTIIPFNNLYNDTIFNSVLLKVIPSVNDAISIYQNLDFDKQVGWSRFLKKIEVFPSGRTNPIRDKIK